MAEYGLFPEERKVRFTSPGLGRFRMEASLVIFIAILWRVGHGWGLPLR